MKIFILTFGCKVNQYESEVILQKFLEHGGSKTNDISDADVIIINSCTVTQESSKKVIKSLHRARRLNKNAIIALTGCMPQAFKEESESLIEADIVVGNSNKMDVISAVMDFSLNKNRITEVIPFKRDGEFENCAVESFSQKTRALLKIQDGCNRFCSYCIIPYARGRVRSKPVKEILKETQLMALEGYKEVVLVGINLSAYGQDIGMNLCDAIEAVCSVDGINRVRLGSLEPEQMDECTILRLSKQDKLCPHFHLSLQSGCDRTLKRMGRHYSANEYLSIVKNLNKHFNNVSITTDVMVGFAGETDEEFKESLDFVEKVGFTRVHVFPYSIRKGTRAALFKDQVSSEVKKKRSQEMLEIANKLKLQFFEQQLNKIEEVLFEVRDTNGYFQGYTKNYLPVYVKTQEEIGNNILKAKITSYADDYCIGELI